MSLAGVFNAVVFSSPKPARRCSTANDARSSSPAAELRVIDNNNQQQQQQKKKKKKKNKKKKKKKKKKQREDAFRPPSWRRRRRLLLLLLCFCAFFPSSLRWIQGTKQRVLTGTTSAGQGRDGR
ncbi:hypothetical protein GTR04_5121 [Trichophyton interdigitale]|uniref:Uncharacterized protein n=1 Tax=Trichophyton interdigitale TaxID=101480 RepID=A0A9P4YEU4_9EURO|nr:hypothetical protein GY632_4786 [Trichophyton interdigitale]KAG5201288.1 hypothetical protein GY631_7576 [Trichophyton interdigitale]KAG8207479.1 hypothetical protein GTR04_5121 [Trichophyton interdigitale]